MKKLLLIMVLLSGCYDLNINPEMDTETETETETEITCDCPDKTICIFGDTENYCIAV